MVCEVSRANEKYKNILSIMQEEKFLPSLLKFHGFDLAMALEFSQTFDGCKAKVASLEFEVTEQTIS